MYPVCLNISGKLCVVIGGGRIVERKILGILAGSGSVRVVSLAITSALHDLVSREVIEWRGKPYSSIDLHDAFLVFAATNNPDVQSAVLRDAHAAGMLVNVVDNPAACDFQVPASIRRGDLTVSVATKGKSPALAAMVKRQLENDFGAEYGQLTTLLSVLRDRILAEEGLSHEEKKILFQKILHDDMVDWLRDRRWVKIRNHLESVLGRPVDLDLKTLAKEAP